MASDAEATWLCARGDDVMVSVHVGPGASRAGVLGVHGGRLRVRVTAPPEGGAANRELVRVLAEALGVRPAEVSIERGGSSRHKVVRVRGVTAGVVHARLAGGLR